LRAVVVYTGLVGPLFCYVVYFDLTDWICLCSVKRRRAKWV